MPRHFKHLTKIAIVFAALLVPTMVVAAEFNDKQRTEMGEIVREYLLKNPEVLRDAFRELERKEIAAKAAGAKTAIVELASDIFRADGDLVIGNPKGDVTLVEFFDYNCVFCKRALPDVLKLVESDKNLKIVLKEFPILGPGSMAAARAAIASRAQGKYWELHLALLKKRGSIDEASVFKIAEKIGLDVEKLKKDMASEEVTAIIQRNHAVAQSLNINGTPAFIVADNIFPGAVGYELLANAVEKVRKSGGCTFC